MFLDGLVWLVSWLSLITALALIISWLYFIITWLIDSDCLPWHVSKLRTFLLNGFDFISAWLHLCLTWIIHDYTELVPELTWQVGMFIIFLSLTLFTPFLLDFTCSNIDLFSTSLFLILAGLLMILAWNSNLFHTHLMWIILTWHYLILSLLYFILAWLDLTLALLTYNCFIWIDAGLTLLYPCLLVLLRMDLTLNYLNRNCSSHKLTFLWNDLFLTWSYWILTNFTWSSLDFAWSPCDFASSSPDLFLSWLN